MRWLFPVLCALLMMTGCVTDKARIPGEKEIELTDSGEVTDEGFAMEDGSELEEEAEDPVTDEESEEVPSGERIIPEEPNQLYMVRGEMHGDSQFVAEAIPHGTCWNENVDDECDIEPTNPREKVLISIGSALLAVEQGEEMMVQMMIPLEMYSSEEEEDIIQSIHTNMNCSSTNLKMKREH